MSICMDQVAQAARHLAEGWTARVRTHVAEERRFSLLLRVVRVQVHSAPCKMSTGALPGVKAAEHRASHPTSS